MFYSIVLTVDSVTCKCGVIVCISFVVNVIISCEPKHMVCKYTFRVMFALVNLSCLDRNSDSRNSPRSPPRPLQLRPPCRPEGASAPPLPLTSSQLPAPQTGKHRVTDQTLRFLRGKLWVQMCFLVCVECA